MVTSYYSTGTVSLTNGSPVVTGIGTGWQLALISGGNVIVQAPGNVLPIASVDSDTQITAELVWTGATGTYSHAIQRDTAYLQSLDQNSQNLSYLLSELRAGTIFKYDQSGDLAGRDLYDARPKNFGYLVTIGVVSPVFYVKASNTDGDWAGPFPYGTGPVGPAPTLGIGTVTTLAPRAAATAVVTGSNGEYDLSFGIPAGLTGINPRGAYNPATAYAERDAVLQNGSTWLAKVATTGNAPPGLPTTENTWWILVAAKGLDGNGAGDMIAATYDPQNLQADAFALSSHTGTLPLSQIVLPTTQTKTAAYTLVAADLARTILLSGTFTLSPTAAATLGSKWWVQLRNIGTGVVTIDPSGSELVDSKATVGIRPGQTCELICDGTAFYTIGLANEISAKFNASAQAELVIPLADGYASHEIIIHEMIPASAAQVHMQVSVDGGVSYISASIAYTWSVYNAVPEPTEFNFGSDYADTKLQLTGTQRASSTSRITGTIDILNALAVGANKRFNWALIYSDTGSKVQRLLGSGEVPSTARITHARLFHPSINIATATVTLRSKA